MKPTAQSCTPVPLSGRRRGRGELGWLHRLTAPPSPHPAPLVDYIAPLKLNRRDCTSKTPPCIGPMPWILSLCGPSHVGPVGRSGPQRVISRERQHRRRRRDEAA
eukprot:4768770-Pyramimonas_sp.AAC.1